MVGRDDLLVILPASHAGNRGSIPLGATILQRLTDSAYKLADVLLTPSDLSNTLIACFIERSLKCE